MLEEFMENEQGGIRGAGTNGPIKERISYPQPSPPLSACAAALCRARVKSAAMLYRSASPNSYIQLNCFEHI